MRFTLIFLLFLMFGCATYRTVEKPYQDETPFPSAPPIQQVTTPEKDPFANLTEKYYRETIHWEKKGDIPKALSYLRIVHRFRSNDPEVSKKVMTWEKWTREESERHFLRGIEKLGQNLTQEARREFLLALAYNPEHLQALDYLRHRLIDPVWIFYEVKKGDSLKKISQETYKDPDKDFLIAYFNDLDRQDSLQAGLTLKLPVLPSISFDKKIPPQEIFRRAPDTTKLPGLNVSLQEQAEIHYAKGMKYFLSEELEKAIEQWEETLRINPNHPHAKRDLQRAQNLLKNLKKRP